MEDVICEKDAVSLSDLADLFKVFGDFTRVKILFALLKSPLCVCDISRCVGMSVSTVSHQLNLLKQSKLVSARREGKSVIYSLADEHVFEIISSGLTHVNEK